MRLGIVGGIVAAVTAFAAPLEAQHDTITLARAVTLARGANPRLAAARAGVQAAGARIGPAGAWSDPQVQLGLMNRPISGMADPMTMNQVTVMQMVPVNGMLGARRRVARADSARVAAGSSGTALAVERDVRAHYWELYHVDQALEVMDNTVAVLRELASVATTMYAVGSVPQADVVRAQTALTRMRQEIEEMRLERVRAAAALNAAMGRAADAPIALSRQHPDTAHHAAMRPLSTTELPPLDSLMAWADSNSPELGAGHAMVSGARAGQTLARRMIWPELSLGLSYAQRSPVAGVGGDDMISAMVGFTVPLFARSRQLRMREEAGYMREQAEADLAAMRIELRAMVLGLREEAETARRLLERVAGTLIPQATAAYDAALAAYRVGRVDFMTVLDARMELLTYQHDVHRYEAMYGAAVAELDRLIGRPFAAPTPPAAER